MSDLDATARALRPSSGGFGDGKSMFTAAAPTSAPDGNETLAWLAGNRMPDRRKGLQPPAGLSDPHADEVLSQPRPNDPIEAAQRRASILADLHQEAPRDPRVISVFDADPIVAQDESNGNLLTQAMLMARLDLFDAVLTMLGRPILARGARSRVQVTLKAAYPHLSDDAQVEWALSEVRLEEMKAWLDQTSQSDIYATGVKLASDYDRSDLWAASRTFSIAAHIGVGQARGAAALADLLEERDGEA